MRNVDKAINRGIFFDTLFGKTVLRANTSLETHTEPLTRADVYHLLKRCCFAIDTTFAKSLIGKSATEAVDLLISNAPQLTKPTIPFDVNKGFPNPGLLPGAQNGEQRYNNLVRIFDENEKLIAWWTDLMKADTRSLSEKVTFFWHGHFTSQYVGGEPIPAQWMYRQNKLFRDLLLGNFREFLLKITLDGAMLLYLNGSQNVFYAPNENYARELFELYSIGIGDGHYSEEDIRQAARVLTGWDVNHFNEGGSLYQARFVPDRFSPEEKVVFGEKFSVDYTINQANVLKHSIEKLIDLILSKKGDFSARFMASKFYRYFVFAKPITGENEVIDELASVFINSGFKVEPMLRKLLTSKHFFDPEMRGSMIKSPLENLLSFTKHFPVPGNTMFRWLEGFGHIPLNPPNVSGWKGYRSWITTKTLPAFIRTFNNILNERSNLEIGQWAATLDGFNNAAKLTESITLLFMGQVPQKDRFKKLENALLGGAPYYEWGHLSGNIENAGLRVKALFREMFRMPEFYLC